MRRMRPARLLIASGLCSALAACSLAPHYERPQLDLPAAHEPVSAQQEQSQREAMWRWWRHFDDPVLDRLIDEIEKSTDPEQILKDAQKAHAVLVDDAPWVFIVHDRNPRAMTKKVKGFTSAQSWFQDFTTVYME